MDRQTLKKNQQQQKNKNHAFNVIYEGAIPCYFFLLNTIFLPLTTT